MYKFFVVVCLFLKFITASQFKCEDGSCYCLSGRLIQFKQPSFNGCGSKGDHIVTPSDWDFEPVCNLHDICYSTCGSNKITCDEDFGDGLVYKCIDNVPGGSRRDYCMTTGNLMYNAVKNFGNKYFENAQKESCRCA